jgi:AAA ATPase-like protein
MTHRNPVGRLFGRERETERLLQAMHRRESLLIWGPAGTGKSALLHEAILRAPARIQSRCIWVEAANGRKEILRQVVSELHRYADPVVRRAAESDFGDKNKFQFWLARQPSRRLGGLAAQAMRETDYWLFLDHLPAANRAVTRLLGDFMLLCKTPIYFTVRGHSRPPLGHAWKLFWNVERQLVLGALTEPAATQLFNSCWQDNGLYGLDREETRRDILRAGGMLPGAIRFMCALACEPRFRVEGRIKARLLRTEYLIGIESKTPGDFAKNLALRGAP